MRPWELHPALVHFPIAFLVGAVVLDIYAWTRVRPELFRYATGLLVAGTASMALTAAAGLLAFFTVPACTEEAGRLMFWHLGLNVAAFVAFTGLAWYRWRDRLGLPSEALRLVGAFALAIMLVSSYLGGEIVYKGGAGVDPGILAPQLRYGAHP